MRKVFPARAVKRSVKNEERARDRERGGEKSLPQWWGCWRARLRFSSVKVGPLEAKGRFFVSLSAPFFPHGNDDDDYYYDYCPTGVCVCVCVVAFIIGAQLPKKRKKIRLVTSKIKKWVNFSYKKEKKEKIVRVKCFRFYGWKNLKGREFKVEERLATFARVRRYSSSAVHTCGAKRVGF